MMEKDNFKIRKIKFIDFLPMGLIFIGVFSFIFFTGTLNSGYHFVDDHEMLSIESGLKNSSFWDVSSGWVKSSLHARFRPMYYFHRVFEMKIFGPNFPALALYTALLAGITFTLFYMGARKMKYSAIESLFFVALAFIGVQASIWWRLGPAETIGSVFLGFAFFFMAKSGERKKYLRDTALFAVFLILASFCKESFVAVIPAFLVYKIWHEKNLFEISVKKSIRNNWILLIPAIASLVEIWVIVFFIGTNDIGYAGSTSGASEMFTGIRMIIFNPEMLFGWMKLLAAVIALYLISFFFLRSEDRYRELKNATKKIVTPFVFAALILLPSLVLYAKSGMMERYLLPTTLGLAFLTIGIWHNTKQIFFKSLILLSIIFFVIISFNTAKANAVIFANDGKNTNELLSTIEKYAQPDSKILLAVDPVVWYEVSLSLRTYLSSKNINNLYAYQIPREYTSDFDRMLEQEWTKQFEKNTAADMPGKPDLIIIIDKNQAMSFFSNSNLQKDGYKSLLNDDNPHEIYVKI